VSQWVVLMNNVITISMHVDLFLNSAQSQTLTARNVSDTLITLVKNNAWKNYGQFVSDNT
jgi:hypothetical protein